MGINYSKLQTKIASVISDFGLVATIQRADGSSQKISMAQAKTTTSMNGSLPVYTGNANTYYVPHSVKKAPAVGDYLKVGTKTMKIKTAEPYSQAGVVIAYKIEVQ